jgi:hypothetical protein
MRFGARIVAFNHDDRNQFKPVGNQQRPTPDNARDDQQGRVACTRVHQLPKREKTRVQVACFCNGFLSRGFTPYVSTLRGDGPRGRSKRARTHASRSDDVQQFSIAKSLFGEALLIDRTVNSCLNILNLPV